ncbi:MAG: hypothetical protein BGP01_11430 [Paludibacter sp. 47-17]|nr:MAG: hypothetical protein BGP01_11430 [Paludibacter sp. 47-17]
MFRLHNVTVSQPGVFPIIRKNMKTGFPTMDQISGTKGINATTLTKALPMAWPGRDVSVDFSGELVY